jgi:hypothetical protein
VLPSIGNEVLKAIVAQFNADQLLTDRPHVSAPGLRLFLASGSWESIASTGSICDGLLIPARVDHRFGLE